MKIVSTFQPSLKICSSWPILLTRSLTRSLQSTGKQDFQEGTDRQRERRQIDIQIKTMPPMSSQSEVDLTGSKADSVYKSLCLSACLFGIPAPWWYGNFLLMSLLLKIGKTSLGTNLL